MDLLLINPGGRNLIYQDLGVEMSAVEPPLWCRLIAGYVADRGYSVQILDSEAENLGTNSVVSVLATLKPRLVGIIAYGHHPSASTQQMAAAGPLSPAIKETIPEQLIIIAGGHVAALPERTMQEEAV
ncbi:MAG TPA: cobalamin-dependent protein, partial [Nitrososphaera sp.]|nr:cobalamin-dependent protein [Nitrososphaera sp.]